MVQMGDVTRQDEGVYLPLVKMGNFTRDMTLASGSLVVMNVGFRPTYILFFASSAPSPAVSIGTSNNVDQERFLDSRHAETANTWAASGGVCISLITALGAQQSAEITTFDVGGFTLAWTKIGSPTGLASVGYIAYK